MFLEPFDGRPHVIWDLVVRSGPGTAQGSSTAQCNGLPSSVPHPRCRPGPHLQIHPTAQSCSICIGGVATIGPLYRLISQSLGSLLPFLKIVSDRLEYQFQRRDPSQSYLMSTLACQSGSCDFGKRAVYHTSSRKHAKMISFRQDSQNDHRCPD